MRHCLGISVNSRNDWLKSGAEHYQHCYRRMHLPACVSQMADIFNIYYQQSHKIDALDQWCLRMLLGINWRKHVRNDEVRRFTKQPHLSAIVQSRRLSLFRHIARMPDEIDAKQILTASPTGNWTRPLGRPRIMWMKTIQQIQRPQYGRRSWLGSEPPTLEIDVYVRRYALLVVLARNDDEWWWWWVTQLDKWINCQPKC